jgi:two-component system NtrC family sensor kinase
VPLCAVRAPVGLETVLSYAEREMSLQPTCPGEEASASPRVGLLARRIAVWFGWVAAVAICTCALLFAVIVDVSGLVTEMRGKELAINESNALATAVREQYTHQAHTLIEGTTSHLEHYQESVDQVARSVAKLRPIVATEDHARLDSLLKTSRQLDTLFRTKLIAAAERGDHALVVRLHHDADTLSQRASVEADAIAASVEAHMVRSHVSATHSTRLGLAVSVLGITLIMALAAGFTGQIRRKVLKPLSVLAQSARRLGTGDFSVRAGVAGEGELREVADAFDRMVQEIRARESRLVEAERMVAIGQLAAGVAHEINNPIGIIRGYLKTMSVDSPPEVLGEELRILDEEAAACQRIAEDLLSYARPLQLRRAAVAMDVLLAELVRRMEETEPSLIGRVHVTAQPSMIAVDEGRVRQLLMNLVRNAIQASPSAEPIDVEGRSALDGSYTVCIADRGPGVSAPDRARIFEPFFSKRAGGSGLGLAVCQGIARAHGGTIGVEDRQGGGALFRVRLPGDLPLTLLEST